MELNLLTRDQVKYLAHQLLDSLKKAAGDAVKATPGRLDDVLWTLAERSVLSDAMVDKAIDSVMNRLGIE